jgi:hypothetical protein
MAKFSEQLTTIITDPFDGPFEGEDYYIDADGIVQVPVDNIKLAAIIMRKVNASGMFDKKLVRVGQGGDNIWLGFDTMVDADAVYTQRIGPNKETLVEVKKDLVGKYCLYINNHRSTRLFKKLITAKNFIKQLDIELKQVAEPFEIDNIE